jgi:hypothetical protein
MGLALLPIHLSVLESALHLPEGYRLILVKHELESAVVNLLVESAEIPDSPTAAPLPRLDLMTSVHYHPEDRSYRKYTVEPKLRDD